MNFVYQKVPILWEMRHLFINSKTISFGVKVGLAAGAVYYISDQGVWRKSDEAVEICNKISTTVKPYTTEIKKYLPYELPPLPKNNEISYLARHYWNKSVIATCGFIANVPTYVGDLTGKGISIIMENIETQTKK